MPILQGVSIPSATESPNDTNSLSVQPTSPPIDTSGEWSVPTSVDPNRPDYSTTDIPLQTAIPDPLTSSVPAAASGGSISNAVLVGIIVSAGVIVMAVALAIIWWIRRRDKSYQSFGHRQQQQQPRAAEEEEKPPTYEAAVYGIYRNDQANLPLHHIPQQSSPAPQPPQTAHHIHSPRPLSAATVNGTLHRLDTTVPHHQNIAEQHADIVIYPHDSPPQTPAPSIRQSALPIRSSQINLNSGSDEVLASHHITDFSIDYPDTVSFNSDFSDNEPTVVREII